MAEAVQLPALSEAQKQSWHALMELYEQVSTNWTLIGGQLVHLHCAERGMFPTRPTNDVDTVVNIRSSPTILATFTGALKDLGFTADISGDGIQHRWRRDLAQIDVLIPEGVGERAAVSTGAGGAPTIPSPGTTQALNRSEPVLVPEIASDRAIARHCTDFVVLASLISARDFRETELARKDRTRLRKMVVCCREDDSATRSGSATRARRSRCAARRAGLAGLAAGNLRPGLIFYRDRSGGGEERAHPLHEQRGRLRVVRVQ